MKFILTVIVFLLLQAGYFCHTVKTVNDKQHVFSNIFHTPHLFQSPGCTISKVAFVPSCFLLIYTPLHPYVFDALHALHNSCFYCICALLLHKFSYFTCITWLRALGALRDLCFYILLWLFHTLKGYLRYKTILCHKVDLDVELMDFFIWRKNTVLFSRYRDFCAFVKSADFKTCDVS